MAVTKDKIHLGTDIPTPEKEPQDVQYNKQANRAEIRSMTPANV